MRLGAPGPFERWARGPTLVVRLICGTDCPTLSTAATLSLLLVVMVSCRDGTGFPGPAAAAAAAAVLNPTSCQLLFNVSP
jgi:hypothetical protein